MRFDAYHPIINAFYFLSMVVFTLVFQHPVYVGISFVSGFLYSMKLKGRKALFRNSLLLPGVALYAFYYSRYNHFGITNLRETAIGNMITLESILYGGVRGAQIASILLWLSCIHEIFTTDKIVYLLGRVSPVLSLYFAITLRTIPRVTETAHRIQKGQEALGRGVRQGNIFRRLMNVLRIFSILITWMTESFVETAESMKSRGYGLKGRTAFSLYRFDNRDRGFIVTLTVCVSIIAGAYFLDQMFVLYDPQLIINPITPASYLFYGVYFVLALLPMMMQFIGEWSFQRRKNAGFQLPETYDRTSYAAETAAAGVS